MLNDFLSFFSKLIAILKRQAIVILVFAIIGAGIGTWKWNSSEIEYRQELLVEVAQGKKEAITQINFLDASGKGKGALTEVLDISSETNSKFSRLKAENVQDTSVSQFNVRYFVTDLSITDEIDRKLGMYLNQIEPSSNVKDAQLFEIPSAGKRSILAFVFGFLCVGIVIAMFREARSQKSES